MPNPIENAREALQRGLAQLPSQGLRTDYTLTLRRYPAPAADAALDMDPGAVVPGVPETLAIAAPNIIPADNAVALAGGVVKAGDLTVKLVRTAEVEAFLKANTEGGTGGPYPELSRVEFLINGEVYRAVQSRPKAMTASFTVRRQAAAQ